MGLQGTGSGYEAEGVSERFTGGGGRKNAVLNWWDFSSFDCRDVGGGGRFVNVVFDLPYGFLICIFHIFSPHGFLGALDFLLAPPSHTLPFVGMGVIRSSSIPVAEAVSFLP